MDKYYYFASELPLLSFDQKTHVNKEGFLEEAKKWLSPGDFRVLYNVDANNYQLRKGDSGVLQSYKVFEETLRQDLAFTRGLEQTKIKSEPSQIFSQQDLEGTPLEVERRFLLLRWNFIEEKAQDHYSDLEFFILYFLKLQILERLFTFNKEKGTVVFDSLSEVKL